MAVRRSLRSLINEPVLRWFSPPVCSADIAKSASHKDGRFSEFSGGDGGNRNRVQKGSAKPFTFIVHFNYGCSIKSEQKRCSRVFKVSVRSRNTSRSFPKPRILRSFHPQGVGEGTESYLMTTQTRELSKCEFSRAHKSLELSYESRFTIVFSVFST